jgi:hypothetical protein
MQHRAQRVHWDLRGGDGDQAGMVAVWRGLASATPDHRGMSLQRITGLREQAAGRKLDPMQEAERDRRYATCKASD